MIPYLQTLWWEWKWRRLKSARSLVLSHVWMAERDRDKAVLLRRADELEHEMKALKDKMRPRAGN